jgi:hypothetical protein
MTGVQRDVLAVYGLSLLLVGCGQPARSEREPLIPRAGEEDFALRADSHSQDPRSRRGDDSESAGELHPAQASVQQMLAHLREGRLDLAIEFLPPRYQDDLNQLVREAAASADPEAWAAVLRTADKLLRVLQEKKPLLLSALDPADAEANSPSLTDSWDELVGILTDLRDSELTQLDKLRQFEAQQFLQTTGNSLFQRLRGTAATGGGHPLDVLQAVRVETSLTPDGRVLLLVTPPGGDVADEVEFVSLEGRWVPRSLVNSWDSMLSGWRSWLLRSAEQGDRHRELLAAVEAGVDRLSAAESVEDVQVVAVPLMVMVRQQWVRLSQPAGPGDGVSLTIQTELSDEQTDRLLAELEQLTDDPERCVYSAVSSGGRTVIAVRPVADVQRFAERLSFAVNPQVDVDMRTINVSALRDR